MQERKKPQRQCIACRACRDKQDLIRVVKTKEGEIMLDRTGRKNGRGAYLCANEECLKKAWKSNALSRSFRMNVKEETYLLLERQLKDGTDEKGPRFFRTGDEGRRCGQRRIYDGESDS